jgi:hypothetical protein
LKSPTTATERALGAHSRELDRAFDEMRAELLVKARVRAFAERDKVVTGQRETGSGDGAHGMSFITTHSSDLPQWLYF